MLLLATTKSGQGYSFVPLSRFSAPKRTTRSPKSKAVAHDEPAEDADVKGEPEEDTNSEDGSKIADLKPRNQRPRSTRDAALPR